MKRQGKGHLRRGNLYRTTYRGLKCPSGPMVRDLIDRANARRSSAPGRRLCLCVRSATKLVYTTLYN